MAESVSVSPEDHNQSVSQSFGRSISKNTGLDCSIITCNSQARMQEVRTYILFVTIAQTMTIAHMIYHKPYDR